MKQIDKIREKNGVVKAVIYARFSSDRQREESIEAQLRAIEAFAERENLVLVKSYIDRGKTATTDRRPEFLQMIQDSKKKMFDLVIVHKLDRFARSRKDSIGYKMELKRSGVSVLSVTEPIDDSPESLILEAMLEAMAEYYSINLGREVMKGLYENALKGLHTGGTPPLGYNVDKATKKLVVNEYEAQAVKLIYEWVIDGIGYNTIIKELNDRGYKTKTGNGFGKNSLHGILRNEKYTGTYIFNLRASKDVDGRYNTHQHKDESEVVRIENAFPAIISKTDFLKVKKQLDSRKREVLRPASRQNIYLLTGVIFCGEYGHRMVGHSRKNGSKSQSVYISYRCNKIQNRLDCSNGEIARDKIEAYVLKKLGNALFDDRLIPQVAMEYALLQKELTKNETAEATELRKQVAALSKKIEKALDVMLEHGASPALSDKLRGMEEEKAVAETRLTGLASTLDTAAVGKLSMEDIQKSFQRARELFIAGKLDSTRILIHNFVEKVIVNKHDVEVQLKFLPDLPDTDELKCTRVKERT